MDHDESERARARRDVQLGRKPGFLDSSAYHDEHRQAEASAGMGVAALVAIPVLALVVAGGLGGLLQAVIAVAILGVATLILRFVSARLPAKVRHTILRWLFIGLAALGLLIAYGLYSDRQREIAFAEAESALDARVAAMVGDIANEPDMAATASLFSDPVRRKLAIIQFNLRHMPKDQKQVNYGWNYEGAIDGNNQILKRSDGFSNPLDFFCSDRIKNVSEVVDSPTLTHQQACGSMHTTSGTNLSSSELDRLVVYTTEMRQALTAKYCARGAKERWRNCLKD